MDKEEMRKAFEEWADQNDLDAYSLSGRDAWLGWQAAMAHSSAGFRHVGEVNCHISGELDLAIGTELFVCEDALSRHGG